MTMTPDRILKTVSASADALVQAAAPYEGLLPSLLDRATGKMLTGLPDPISGQRNGDRSTAGCNLMHDQVLLRTWRALSTITGRKTYHDASERYLRRFAEHCTGTPSGLFPWGEHAYWSLAEDGLGDSYRNNNPQRPCEAIHDHLRAAPLWLWERLWDIKPDCVVRFAEGLDNHWTADAEGASREYIRHALIQRRERHPRAGRSCDFPRHGGFYVFDLAFAYSRTGRADLLAQLRAFADYWWPKRDEQNLCLLESRTPEDPAHVRRFRVPSPSQTLSLAVSLLEAAALLESLQSELARELRSRAATYIDGFFSAPHDPDRGVFIINCVQDEPSRAAMPVWCSVYGLWPVAYVAVFALCGYRLTGDRRLLDWAVAAGRAYQQTPFPEGAAVPAMDAGLAVGLQADLYDLTGEARWREGGLTLAEHIMGRYLDQPIPRGAAGIDWYESQMGPGFLLHGLTRLALLAQDRAHCPLDADYTTR